MSDMDAAIEEVRRASIARAAERAAREVAVAWRELPAWREVERFAKDGTTNRATDWAMAQAILELREALESVILRGGSS